MASKKGPRMFANVFCRACKTKVGSTEFNKKNHTLADLAEKIKVKFCFFCHSKQDVKLKELK